jgi:hypothetical protein
MDLPLWDGLSLRIHDPPVGADQYATSRLQRGLLLLRLGEDMAEEAVGFGVPVLKRGLQTIFPGRVALDASRLGSGWRLNARFRLDRVEKISKDGHRYLEGAWLYAVKNLLAALMRHWPVARSPLTAASSRLRHLFGWQTTYAEAGYAAQVAVTYDLQPPARQLGMQVELSSLPPDVTEAVIMNEQGAHHFDRYRDSSGLSLQGSKIGCWDAVRAGEAWFESRAAGVAFGLHQVQGARLFRGRELIGSRLAWAGFGYSFAPAMKQLRYELTITGPA